MLSRIGWLREQGARAGRRRVLDFGLGRRAFTVIEMVGVLAIISLLAAAVLPNMIRRYDRVVWEREKADQQAMADALTASILRNKTVPNISGIPFAIAKEMALSLSGITNTPRTWGRAFLFDRLSNIGGGITYTQTVSGTVRPRNARVMILASIAGNLPVTSRADLGDAEFQAIWDTPEGAKPTTSTWTTWTGQGEDLLIKKLDLEPLFYQLMLVNNDEAHPASAFFSIDSSSVIYNVPATNNPPLWNAYYLDGTVLGLYDCNPSLQTRYLLQRSISFAFESCTWRGQIQGSGIQTATNTTSLAASNFVIRATTFYNEPTSPTAQSGSSQTSVLVALYTFMFDYVFWATECPHFDGHGQVSTSIPEYQMLNDMGQNSQNGNASIDSLSGKNGLLK